MHYIKWEISLSEVNEEKDLGLIFTKDLKAVNNCGEVVKKANRILGMIKRNFQDKSVQTILPLYNVICNNVLFATKKQSEITQ